MEDVRRDLVTQSSAWRSAFYGEDESVSVSYGVVAHGYVNCLVCLEPEPDSACDEVCDVYTKCVAHSSMACCFPCHRIAGWECSSEEMELTGCDERCPFRYGPEEPIEECCELSCMPDHCSTPLEDGCCHCCCEDGNENCPNYGVMYCKCALCPIYCSGPVLFQLTACCVAMTTLSCYKTCRFGYWGMRKIKSKCRKPTCCRKNDPQLSLLPTSDLQLVYTQASPHARIELEELSTEKPRFNVHVNAHSVVKIVGAKVVPRMKVTGDLFLEKLTEDVQVLEDVTIDGGNLVIGQPANLETIQDMHVGINLYIAEAETLKTLERVHVENKLFVHGASSLKALPPSVTVNGGIDLRDTGLEVFPAHISKVDGDLTLIECPELLMLGLALREVQGTLAVKHCTNFVSLAPWAAHQPSERLIVTGDLLLRGCTALESLPWQLEIYGNVIDVRGCVQLSSFPEQMLISFADRNIEILASGSGISEDTAARINLQFPNIEISVESEQESDGEYDAYNGDPFEALTEVATYFHCGGLPLKEHVEKAYEKPFLRFFDRLRESREFSHHQESLRMRVREVLQILCFDKFASKEILLHIVDASDSCEDKPVWALNQMMITCRAAHARGNLSEMRRLGLGVMRLGVVHEHARRYMEENDDDLDDVSLYLQLELRLRDKLDLPISTQRMVYPMNLPSALVDAICLEALLLQDDSPAFEAWLEQWDEWRREMRRVFYEEHTYDTLQVPTKEMDVSGETNLMGDHLHDPVLFNGQLCSYSELMSRWVDTGMDFFNVIWDNSSVLISKLVKVLPRDDCNNKVPEKARLRPESLPRPARRRSSAVSTRSARSTHSKKSNKSHSASLAAIRRASTPVSGASDPGHHLQPMTR